jgi:2-polyprenyl-6-methoxyphenol hydroxylase-like FAD-dependent oxidoreductase
MNKGFDTTVLIVGAGPVGLTLAIDLAWRGIDVTVCEMRQEDEPPNPRCNQISARSMENFRRLGIAGILRDAGLPADYPNDVVSCTSVTGIELSRVEIPSRAERTTSKHGPDTSWPTPEHTHRISQTVFEPILLAHARSQSRIHFRHRTVVQSFTQSERGVVAVVRDIESDGNAEVRCQFIVGCDGARSMVRKAIGAKLAGTPVVQRVQSTAILAPALLRLLRGKPAWLYYVLNPRRCGSVIAVDGRETWQVHNFLYRDEEDFDSVDRDWSIRQMLGVGADFEYKIVAREDWIARRLVADQFGKSRAFICGDAAHLWIPHAGYGMNAGIADATDLAWMLAAVLDGWAAPELLAAYEAERRPITEQVSHHTTDVAHKLTKFRREVPIEIEAPGPAGDAVRARIGSAAHDADVEQQCCAGLNFGYFYDRSPIIAYDGEQHPPYTMGAFTSSTVPGCRVPHVWLAPGCSLYDALGTGYSLICLDQDIDVAGLVAAAERRGMPLSIVNLTSAELASAYRRKLLIVRPDQHVAWRGDVVPPDPLHLVDHLRGAGGLGPRRLSCQLPNEADHRG